MRPLSTILPMLNRPPPYAVDAPLGHAPGSQAWLSVDTLEAWGAPMLRYTETPREPTYCPSWWQRCLVSLGLRR